MKPQDLSKRTVAAILAITIAASGCSTAQLQQMKQERNEKLQKQYPSFSKCFSDEKVLAMAGGAIVGGLVGLAIGGKNSKTAGALGAVLGGIVGNRVAWQSCLDAFAPKPLTVVVNDRASTLAQTNTPQTQAVAKTLSIQQVKASPLVFGTDLELDVTYKYLSDNPNTRDIKARVSRSLLFKGPDGTQHEVPSVTEDTIQQGNIRTKFAIPTPSIQDAAELKSTTDWAFKFVVEVDGMRQEQIVKLEVSSTPSTNASDKQGSAANSVSNGAQSNQDKIALKKGTTIYGDLNSTKVVSRLAAPQSGTVLQRSDQGKTSWIQVRLADGKQGWIKVVKK